jgi:manganese oxidase
MTSTSLRLGGAFIATALLLLVAGSARAQSNVHGIAGPSFDLTASAAHIDTPDGDSLLVWGYGLTGGSHGMQYPGPTLVVNEGDEVVITLRNALAVPVSMVFPGQGRVTTAGGAPGLLTSEAAPGATVEYRFVASRPGTYLYQSGTRPELQIEMGLFGALIVRPSGFDAGTNRRAYGHAGSSYDHEYLFVLSEMDPRFHNLVEFGGPVDNTRAKPVLWFVNGRNAPDTMLMDHVAWMPHQPYGAMARMHPGEKVLMRIVGAGRDLHPFHHHGNFATLIARDGRLLASANGAGEPGFPDLATTDFTQQVLPGSTMDAIFQWTGKGLGYDIYGHAPGAPLEPHEYAPDHGKPLPVTLPELQDVAFGGHWSGSPYLGQTGPLPPGQGGLNPTAGFFFMWHSHTERELVNNDVFPGGMMTMLVIEPPGVPIP